jgi:hypothetical protein
MKRAIKVTSLVVLGVAAIAFLVIYHGTGPPGHVPFWRRHWHSAAEHGRWEEVAQLGSDGTSESRPAKPIRELPLHAQGFSVTWKPFETYKDYWGTYVLNADDGTIQMVVAAGNYVPEDFDGTGSLVLDEAGDLVLRGVWLGSPRDAPSSRRAGHRFRR